MSANTLTRAERITLNRAMEIILANTPQGASWLIDARWTGVCPKHSGLTYFTGALHTQHSFVRGETFADKVQAAIDFEAAEHDDPDKAKAERVASLRAQIERLTGEAA